ncbi:MAG TPA: MarR family transcriptional regulator [Thermoleophilaceae bacterium]|nr:MarR family transcriptional regulator [Thermoleophilaceae bacterium]
MTAQASLEDAAPAVRAWGRLLRAQATTKRELAAELQAEHGLSMTAYETLYVLARADGRRLKRVDLAERLVLTPSGVTRLLEGLEAAGLIEKVACETDLRVSYAQLTDAGFEKLEQASCGHTGSVRALFEEHLDDSEIEQLAELLGKLPGALDEGQSCPRG